MKKYSMEELAEVLKKHRAYLLGEQGGEFADLRSADLRSANLRSADLYGANLRSADLYGANLRSADLRSADLYGADLRSADLYGANLYGANLGGANLGGANLRSADLRSADLGGASYLACMLRVLGACDEAVRWVDSQEDHSFDRLMKEARPDWKKWLSDALGGEATPDRLLFVFNYITDGVA